jgi:hypothetical protein
MHASATGEEVAELHQGHQTVGGEMPTNVGQDYRKASDSTQLGENNATMCGKPLLNCLCMIVDIDGAGRKHASNSVACQRQLPATGVRRADSLGRSINRTSKLFISLCDYHCEMQASLSSHPGGVSVCRGDGRQGFGCPVSGLFGCGDVARPSPNLFGPAFPIITSRLEQQHSQKYRSRDSLSPHTPSSFLPNTA